jgi:hypothetical protein
MATQDDVRRIVLSLPATTEDPAALVCSSMANSSCGRGLSASTL